MSKEGEIILNWVRSLDKTRVPIVQLDCKVEDRSFTAPFHSIDLAVLTKDILKYSDVREWWNGKNMTDYLRKNVAMTILSNNPPDEVKNIILLLML